ncbi:MAG: glycosyltransferase [Nitrospirae bacterium]|jgi:spore maturation protein CgeB|nr:glycosyltransferase [Nitrospirota bacterium]
MESRESLFQKNADMFGEGGLARRVIEPSPGVPLEVVPARSGSPSMKAGPLTLHSLYDPEKEGSTWAEDALGGEDSSGIKGYIVAGLGLGHHVWALLSRTELPVHVLETDPRRIALSWGHFEWYRFGNRIRFSCDPADVRKMPSGFRLLVHAPSEKLDPDSYREIRRILEDCLQEFVLSYRILVIPPVYGGSYPVARSAARALENLGHRTTFLDMAPFEGALRAIGAQTSFDLHKMQLRGIFQGFLDELIFARVVHEKPDLIVALAQAPVSPSLLARFRKENIPVAYWFVEDFRLATYWESVAPLVTDFAVIQKDPFFSILADKKVNHVSYLPLAADTAVFSPRTPDEEDRRRFGGPVTFMGAGYPNRHHFLKSLADFDLSIFGTEWNVRDPLYRYVREGGRRLSSEETALVFNATTVNINLHSSVYHRGVNPEGDFVNPRTFEIAACGAFQVVDRRSLLSGLFEVDEDLAVYRNESECRNLVARYLKDPGARQEMANRSRARVLREHTYEIRMSQWIDVLKDRGIRPARPSLTGRWPVEKLVSDASGEPELVEFLEKFRGREPMSLEEIARSVAPGKGEISGTEATFLLLAEIASQGGGG